MKQVIALVAAICLMLTAAADRQEVISVFGAADEDVALLVDAKDSLTVLSTHVMISIGPDDMDSLLLYAELRNDSDMTVQPKYVISINDDVSELVYEDERWECYPWIIEPGETAYFCGMMELDAYREDRELERLSKRDLRSIRVQFFDGWSFGERDEPVGMPSITTVVEEIEPPRHATDVWKAQRVTLVNDSGEDYCVPTFAVGAYDAQGRLLFFSAPGVIGAYESGGALIIPDGGSLVVDTYEYNAIGKEMEACGLEIAEYRCIVY